MKSAKTFDLGGPSWTMRHFLEGTLDIQSPDDLRKAKLEAIPATVPGNYELDLMAAGELKDPFVGENCFALRPLEFHQWWYERTFPTLKLENPELVFEGLDDIADVWLNGVKLGSTDNALIPWRFEVAKHLAPVGKENVLHVCIKSPVNACRDKQIEPWCRGHDWDGARLFYRKPPHCNGWDIMLRCLSGGIWRPVYLRERLADEIVNCYLVTRKLLPGDKARLSFFFNCRCSALVLDGLAVRLTGICGKSKFSVTQNVMFPVGHFGFVVEHPRLWWPAGYGEPALYDVTFELLQHGKVLCSKKFRTGIRTIKLDRTDLNTPEHPGRFQFIVNDVPVFVKGSNWVPADALHSRDVKRIPDILKLFKEMGCSILRCWGGNVYENHQFFDLCDEYGIMVWQDFTFACWSSLQDEASLTCLRPEIEHVVREYRQHPCIALWAGDNEVDSALWGWHGPTDPAKNRINREVIPQIVDRLDLDRDYLPSSPYMTPPAVALNLNIQDTPEQHLWGPRDYFKSNFYANNTACFASEMGYHGCPATSSIQKMMAPKYVWPYQNNPQWDIHSTNPCPHTIPSSGRIELMTKQILEMFGEVPTEFHEYVTASQIVQAEAKKFFVEIFRQRRPFTGGIIWWNMMDGWPQISDAIVDYYFKKKLAFHYLKRVHKPLCGIIAEPEAWNANVLMCNDSRQERTGHLTVTRGLKREVVLDVDFRAPANGNIQVGQIRMPRSENELYLLEWTANGKERGVNHYISGTPPFSFATYKKRLKLIRELDPFDWSC